MTNAKVKLQADSNDLMRQAQVFLYANGNDHPPTAIDLNKSLLRDLLFNQSPAKVDFYFLWVILHRKCIVCLFFDEVIQIPCELY